MKRLLPYFIASFVCSGLYAQNWDDALRYSQTYSGGTARSTAMGGAFGALGADFFCVSQNPAGLGMYRKSELTFTTELYHDKVVSEYRGNRTEDYKYNFNINNFGYVSSRNKKGDNGFIGGSFAVGFNRLNNFHSNIQIQGNNNESSLADSYAELANLRDETIDPNYLYPFTEGLFYDANLMYQDSNNLFYFIVPELEDGILGNGISQRKNIERSGKMNEWVFSGGLNFNHMIYVGATFSIIPVYFEENSTFAEGFNSNRLEYFNFYEWRHVSGVGYSGKFGVIVSPISMLRIGAAFHLPTSFFLHETFNANIQSAYNSNSVIFPVDEWGVTIDEGRNDYKITSPYKAIASLGVILGKFAILSADLEYLDYSTMRISDGSYGNDFYEENDAIRTIYRDNFNLKAGAEFRLSSLYLRTGVGFYGSPYKDDQPNAKAYEQSYSAGIGYRDDNMFIDFTWNYLYNEEKYTLYSWTNKDYRTNLSQGSTKMMMTIGFRF